MYLYLPCFCIDLFMYIYSYFLLVYGLLPPSENSIAVSDDDDDDNNNNNKAYSYGVRPSDNLTIHNYKRLYFTSKLLITLFSIFALHFSLTSV